MVAILPIIFIVIDIILIVVTCGLLLYCGLCSDLFGGEDGDSGDSKQTAAGKGKSNKPTSLKKEQDKTTTAKKTNKKDKTTGKSNK